MTVPLALVNLDCAVVSRKAIVAALDGLERDVLLGHDLDKTCGEMLAKEMCILTRAQAKTEIEDYVQGECALMSDDMVVKTDEDEIHSVTCSRVGEVGVDAEGMHREMSGQELGSIANESMQKDDEKQAVSHKDDDSIQKCLQFDKHTLINLQQSDDSLQGIRID